MSDNNVDRNSEASEEEAVTIKRTKRVRQREALVGWTQIAANVLVPFSIFLAAASLIQDNFLERKSAAQRQIEIFYSQNLSESQQVLFALWNNVDLTILRSPQSRSFIDAFVERAIATGKTDPREISSAITNLASYFDRVEACMASKRCEETEILLQLGQYGRDFHCIYLGQIKRIQRDSLILDLGKGLESFAKRNGGCSDKSS